MCADLGISRSTFDKSRKRGKGPRMKRFPDGDLRCRRDWSATWSEQSPDDDYRPGDEAGRCGMSGSRSAYVRRPGTDRRPG